MISDDLNIEAKITDMGICVNQQAYQENYAIAPQAWAAP